MSYDLKDPNILEPTDTKNSPDPTKLPDLKTSSTYVLKKLEVPKFDHVTAGLITSFLTGLLIWYFIQYYDLLLPFMSGGLSLLKYFVICITIFYIMVLFIQTTLYFSFWYASTLYHFRHMVNPLLNHTVRYYYYYFTDYINWIIFYPARFWYGFRFTTNILFFILVILPVMAFIAFFIGILFSWLGEKKETFSIFKEGLSSIADKGIGKSLMEGTGLEHLGTGLASGLASALPKDIASALPKELSSGIGSNLASKMSTGDISSIASNVAKGDFSKVSNLAKSAGVSDNMVRQATDYAKSSGIQTIAGLATSGVPGIGLAKTGVDSIKGLAKRIPTASNLKSISKRLPSGLPAGLPIGLPKMSGTMEAATGSLLSTFI